MPRRKTMGEILREERQAQGLSIEKLQQRIADQLGVEIGTSTIRETETGRFGNPGIKTIELIARGLGLEPLKVMRQGLSEPPEETEEQFAKSRFLKLWQAYERLNPARRAWFDEFLDMILDKMGRG